MRRKAEEGRSFLDCHRLPIYLVVSLAAIVLDALAFKPLPPRASCLNYDEMRFFTDMVSQSPKKSLGRLIIISLYAAV
jgi:hypothetical protein